MMNVSNFQVFAEGDPGAGLLAIAMVIAVCWFCSQMNKPKGYVIESGGRTTIKPIK